MEKLYTRSELQYELKKAGLPSAYPTILRYEKTGVISKPVNAIHYVDRSWRLYTSEEIERIIRQIKGHRGLRKLRNK